MSASSLPRRAPHVPLGDTTIPVEPPPGWLVSVAERPEARQPKNSLPIELDEPLEDLAAGARKVVIAFTDLTRACPDSLLIPPLLERLAKAGVPRDGITLLCAIGMHRPISNAEMVTKLGEESARRYRVVNHDPADAVPIGEVDGVPLLVNRLCLEADLVLATGIVEPHHYAGWSGGGKTVAIGCGGAETVAATHSPRYLDDGSVRLGRVDGNAFQRVVRESARLAGLRYVVNVGLDEDGEIVAQVSGPPDQVHDKMVAHMASFSEVPTGAPFDVAIAGVGPPKDVNLYQATRAATYVGFSQHQLLKSGGVIILPATCPEGAGQGIGEQNFYAGMSTAPDMDTLLDRLRREGCRPGEQRAFILGKVLRDYPIIVVGAKDPDLVRACHMTPAVDMAEALQLASRHLPSTESPSLLVVPHATQTLPIPES